MQKKRPIFVWAITIFMGIIPLTAIIPLIIYYQPHLWINDAISEMSFSFTVLILISLLYVVLIINFFMLRKKALLWLHIMMGYLVIKFSFTSSIKYFPSISTYLSAYGMQISLVLILYFVLWRYIKIGRASCRERV